MGSSVPREGRPDRMETTTRNRDPLRPPAARPRVAPDSSGPIRAVSVPSGSALSGSAPLAAAPLAGPAASQAVGQACGQYPTGRRAPPRQVLRRRHSRRCGVGDHGTPPLSRPRASQQRASQHPPGLLRSGLASARSASTRSASTWSIGPVGFSSVSTCAPSTGPASAPGLASTGPLSTGPVRTGWAPGGQSASAQARLARLRDAGRAGYATGTVALPRMPFVLLVLVLLGGGLICLLVINTTLGATSFRISQPSALAPPWRRKSRLFSSGSRRRSRRPRSQTAPTSSGCVCRRTATSWTCALAGSTSCRVGRARRRH